MTSVDDILSSLTPESIERTILDIAGEDKYAGRDTLAVGLIADRILRQHDLARGTVDSAARDRVARKIAEQVGLIEGMRYFEND